MTTVKHQQGAILFISLIILLLVTIVAIGSTRLSTTGQRISMNYQMKNSTFQAADSSLVLAEAALEQSALVSEGAKSAAGHTLQSTLTNDVINQNITTVNTIRRIGVSGGNSLAVDGSAPRLYVYVIDSTSNINGLSISTELEEGFIKPDVISN